MQITEATLFEPQNLESSGPKKRVNIEFCLWVNRTNTFHHIISHYTFFEFLAHILALTPIISKYFFFFTPSHYIIRQHKECISDKRKLLKLENRDLLCIMPVILAIGLIETWNCILVGKYFVTHIKKLLLQLKLVNLPQVWYFRKIAATFSDIVH